MYGAVVLDTFSRRVVGWSIDSSQTAALVTHALSMTIANRDLQAGGDCSLRPRRAVHLVGPHRPRQALRIGAVDGVNR